jgi:WD40 repeat protein
LRSLISALLVLSAAGFGHAACPAVAGGAYMETVPWSTVRAFAVDRDAGQIAAFAADGTLMSWNTSTRLRSTVVECMQSVVALAFSPDGKLLIAGGQDGSLSFIRFDLPAHPMTSRKLPAGVGRIVVAASGNGMLTLQRHSITLWNLDQREIIWDRSLAAELTSAAFSPDGSWIAVSAGQDILIWEAATGKLVRRFRAQKRVGDFVGDVTFTPDGKTLLAGLFNDIAVLDAVSGRQLRALSGHTNFILSLTVPEGGRLAVSVADDRTLRTWNLDTGALISTSNLPPGIVSRDGRYLTSAIFNSGRVEMWELSSKRLLQVFAYQSPRDR